MALIEASPAFFLLLAGMAFVGLVYMWISLEYRATVLFFSIVRRSEAPVLYWATVGINGFALALVYFGVLYVAFFGD